MSARTCALAAAAAVAAGAVYVLIHERRRREKKELQRLQEQPIPKEMLVEILQEASVEAANFAEQISAWVVKMQQEHSLTEERAHAIRQVRAAHSCPRAAVRGLRASRARAALTFAALTSAALLTVTPHSNDLRRRWTR
jgi:hypothetical protein